MTTALSRSLKQHEEIIADGMKSFLYVGQSLMAIRDGKLYSDNHDTFEAYCKSRWGFSRPRAYQMIEAAEVVSDLSTNGRQNGKKKAEELPLPENERQARALKESADTPEERREVWAKAVEIAPKNEAGEPQVTAKIISQVADEVVGPKVETPKPAKAEKPEPVVEVVKEAEKPSEFPEGFDPTEFDPEMNPALDRKSVAKLDREQQLVEQPKMIEAFCRSVHKFFNDNLPSDPLLDEGSVNIAQQQLKSALNTLRQRKAYGACPKCPEKIHAKCGFCKGVGYVNKTTFESAGGVK